MLPRYYFLLIGFGAHKVKRPTFGRAYTLYKEVATFIPGVSRKVTTTYFTRGYLALRSTFRQLTSEQQSTA